MKNRLRAVVLLCSVAAAFPGVAFAMDDDPEELAVPANPDYAQAKQAIKAGQWDRAVDLLTRAASQDERNPDIYNSLGYAERHRGNLPAAFKHYGRALALDPKHRGAHEYVGEAYLMVDDPAKAQEHLAALDKLCFLPCAEYRELEEKIAAYKRKRR